MARRRRSAQRRDESAIGRVEIEYEDLHSITPYERNPRENEHAIESVANSIRAFGFLVPIVIGPDGEIAAGHTRYEAARMLGLDEVPVIRANHLTEEQLAQFRLIDNKVAELARWDFDLLGPELSALRQTGLDFTQFGWTQEEIDCLTDMVASDCLSAGDVADVEAADRARRAERRAPNRTRLVLGDIVFFVPEQVYRGWMNDVRAQCDFDEAEVIRELKRRLGITPFEQEYVE